MRTLTSWLILIFTIVFWLFRVIVTFLDTMEIDFIVKSIDINTEIMILFITLICIILILKRKLIGGIVYLISYLYYFGLDIYNKTIQLQAGEQGTEMITTMIISCLAVLLAISAFVDLLVNLTHKGKTRHKKTDWFYGNEKYDRELDDRADKNNYRIH